MSDYTTGDDCIWPHCSTIATCPCCRKDAEIERLQNDITTFIRDAHFAGYMAGVGDSEDYDHDPTVMEEYAFIEYLQKGDDE